MRIQFRLILAVLGLLVSAALSGCSKDDKMRIPEDILGVWSAVENQYLDFTDNYRVYNLDILYQDDLSIGDWTEDAYIYEPGYQLVIYMNGAKADVYQIVKFSSSQFTWCWVEEINAEDAQETDKIGKLLGRVIKQAQEGYKLNPELYETFYRISDDKFYSILDGLDIFYPWWEE